MSVIREHIQKLTPYVPPLDGRNPEQFTLLDFNERTVPVPGHVTDALKKCIADDGILHLYPSYGDLQERVAEYARVPKEQCLVVNGSDQAIDLVFRCCCEPGTEVIIPAPTFAMYEQAALSEGLIIRQPKFERDKGFPLEEVLEMVNPNTSLIVLANPNNPTATAIPKVAMMEICRKVACAVMVDECYFEYMPPEETMKGELDTFKNLFVCRTFSKTWGLPSLRLGYVLSAEINLDCLRCVRGPYDINKLAAVALDAAMADPKYVWDFVEEVMTQAKPRLEEWLRNREIVFWPSSANFIMCYFDNPAELESGLRARNILVRPKKDAEGVVCLRITIGTLAQMEALITALEELLRERELANENESKPINDV